MCRFLILLKYQQAVDSLNRTPVGIVDKLSSRQLLDFIRSKGKGDSLCLILVLRCSIHMLRCLNMPSMPCSSMYMPIIITNSKLRGGEQDSDPYMIRVTLTHIPVECRVVDPYIYRFLNGSGLN